MGLRFEDAGEDGVDVGELAGEVEGGGELRGGEEGGDGGVAGDFVAEDEALLPGAHGVGLDERVGVFAGLMPAAARSSRSWPEKMRPPVDSRLRNMRSG